MSKKRNNPHIIFILSDDQGSWAMGCAGNPELITPNLDRIASEGMRFTNFFCASPVCSPARATLLTGRIPSQHGVHDWIREGDKGERAIEYLEGQLAYTEVLAEHGYLCGLSGKWHLGDSYKPQKAFRHWYAHERGGGPYYGAPMIREGRLEHEPRYLTEAITDDALSFIDTHADGDQPFYLSVHYTAPHSPWIDNHPKKYTDMYRDCKFESCPQDLPHDDIYTRAMQPSTYERASENLVGYFAAITAMDAQIGRLLERLDQRGIAEDTLLIFTSDNGYNCGHHGIWGKGNGTFPQNMYDSSVKVPFLVCQPGTIPKGQVCDELVSGYDFMPSLLEMAGIAYQHPPELPGQSFAALMEGRSQERDECIVVYDEYGPVRMVRSKEWKYVHRYPYGPHELYDLVHDSDERCNLIDEPPHALKVEQMRAMLADWFHTYVDPAIDGAREPVTGRGQLDLAGVRSRGRRNYADSH